MKLAVKFSENSQVFNSTFNETQQVFSSNFKEVQQVTNGGGTTLHDVLLNRDKSNQHPMSAITGLVEALNTKATSFKTDETLSMKNGTLSVNTTSEVESDNTLPITSAAVSTTVGNIEILLSII